MYPVPRHSKTVIGEWAVALASRFNCSIEVVQGQSEQWLSFPNETVRIELMDESCVEFKYAFHLISEAQRSIAVFTEHCGHHVFPYHEAKVFINGALFYEQTIQPLTKKTQLFINPHGNWGRREARTESKSIRVHGPLSVA